MKYLTFLFFLFALIYMVSSSPLAPPPPQILKSSYDLSPEGAYQYLYETEDGMAKEETGSIKIVKDEKGKDEPVVVAQGSYSYVDPDGNKIVLTYVADENGFHPQGAHLPTL